MRQELFRNWMQIIEKEEDEEEGDEDETMIVIKIILSYIPTTVKYSCLCVLFIFKPFYRKIN